jgi:hypothetical protein
MTELKGASVMCTHQRDSSWQTDLIWHYFHEITTSARPWGTWHKTMDPKGELSDRHHVYELLVDQGDQTNPQTQDLVGESMIPWNQQNMGFMQDPRVQKSRALWCGSIVKIVFCRYMGWDGVEPRAHSVNQKGFDAANLTVDQLNKKKPVRVAIGGHHFVGIVGHRTLKGGDNEFLYIDPLAGGISTGTKTITYAGTETRFLGIITQHGSTWRYDASLVTAVEVLEPHHRR